jgi:hypothetical protein
LPILIRRPDGPYGSQGDERAFFEWLNRIPAVYKIGGVGEELHIHVRSRLSSESLRELIALFDRYDGPLNQLAQFENSSNRNWFRNPEMYWYRQVFLGSKRSHRALSRLRKRTKKR